MSTIASRLSEKYSFNREMNDNRIKKEIIVLPINTSKEPDYEFMEAYMREKESELLEQYRKHAQTLITSGCKQVEPLSAKDWKEFYLKDLFDFQKGNQNNMTILNSGTIPLVSAKNGDNGYKGFVASNNKKIFPQSCLTLNNDGDGGAGISYYQPHKLALDSHVTALLPKSNLNKHKLLFLSRSITSQKNKFGHGYSLTNNRLAASKLMLPINDNDMPDYIYMEQYMRNLEQRNILQYLEYIESSTLKQR